MFTSEVTKLNKVVFPEFNNERIYMQKFYKQKGLPSNLEHWQENFLKKLLIIFILFATLLFLVGCDKPQKVQIATYTQQSPVDPIDLNLSLKKVLDREKIAEDASKSLVDRISSHSIKKHVPTYSCTTYYNGNDSIDICK